MWKDIFVFYLFVLFYSYSAFKCLAMTFIYELDILIKKKQNLNLK